jgi:2-amino-4-hydroxy-6-hydroxymethyldihydropteridine diphosphokinase
MMIRCVPVSTQRIVIGLGSNIAAESNLKSAANMLRALWPDIRFSPVYQTAPRELLEQEVFLNAIATFESSEKPQMIKKKLEAIEHDLKKNPPVRFGPRTIDLDLLLVGDTVSKEPSLLLPHPRMHERRFVLEPLCLLIDPTERHPVSKEKWEDLLEKTMDQACEQTDLIRLRSE